MAYEIIDKILSTTDRNILVIRNTAKTNKQSTFARLKKYIYQIDPINNPKLNLSSLFKFNNNELVITRKATGQVILFAGMDDPQKIASIEVVNGFLTDVYVEEAFELKSYDDWRVIDGTIRGDLPNGLFHQITFCFNAWSKKHRLYDHFFKGRLEDDQQELENKGYQEFIDENEYIDFGKGIALHIGSYKVNEFRAKDYDKAMEILKQKAIDIWRVEALGMWGISTGATYPHFKDDLIISPMQIQQMDFKAYAIGIDTGFSNGQGKLVYDKDMRCKSATTMQLVGITRDCQKLVCVDEFFFPNTSENPKTSVQILDDIAQTIAMWRDSVYFNHNQLMKGTIPVYVDCADIGSRESLELKLREHRVYNAVLQGSTKMNIDTRVRFTNLLMAYGDFNISSNCQNLVREIRNSNVGENGEPREDFDDHAINSCEYAWASIVGYLRSWKTFK